MSDLILTMTPALSDDLKIRIVSWYFEEGLTYREIRDRANCSIGLISKVMSNYSAHGQVTNPFSKQTGRPTKIQDGDVEYISSLIEANPVLYLDEIQHQLLSTHGIEMSISSLSCLLIQYGLTVPFRSIRQALLHITHLLKFWFWHFGQATVTLHKKFGR